MLKPECFTFFKTFCWCFRACYHQAQALFRYPIWLGQLAFSLTCYLQRQEAKRASLPRYRWPRLYIVSICRSAVSPDLLWSPLIFRAILDAAAPFDTPSKPKRVRTMTEKARLMQQDAQEDRRPSKVTRVASSNVGVSVKQEKVEDVYVFYFRVVLLGLVFLLPLRSLLLLV